MTSLAVIIFIDSVPTGAGEDASRHLHVMYAKSHGTAVIWLVAGPLSKYNPDFALFFGVFTNDDIRGHKLLQIRVAVCQSGE